MLTVQRLRVRSLDIDFHEVSWEVAATHESVLDYTFTVLRSESPSGPFETLGAPFEDRYIFIDADLEPGNRWRMYHYVVRVTRKRDGVVVDTLPVAREAEPDLVALELRRHMQLLMHEFAGRQCWVLPRRTFGQRCSCWDPVLQQPTRGGCRLCWSTGFVRGYLSPIEVWMQIDPSAKTNTVSTVGTPQQGNTTARCGYYPPLKPQDLVIEAENRRWRVVSVSATEKGRAPIHQEVTLHEIPPRDIEFSIELTLDRALRDLWVSPPRNFSNPHTLDNVRDEEVPNIFALYPTRVRP